MTWTGLHLRRRTAQSLRAAVLGALDRAILALEPPEEPPPPHEDGPSAKAPTRAETNASPPTPTADVIPAAPSALKPEAAVPAPADATPTTKLPPLPKPRAPRAARARATEAPPLPEAPPPPPPEQRLQVAREREQRREARARPGILAWLDGCGGEAKTVALMQHVADDYKISGQRFSVILEELSAEGLIIYTPATQTVALTDAGRVAAAH